MQVHILFSGLLFSLSCVNPIPFSVRVNRMGEAKHAQLSFPHRIVRRRHYRTRKRSFTLLLPSHSQNENQLRERTGRERGGGGAGPQGRGKGGVKAGGERERESRMPFLNFPVEDATRAEAGPSCAGMRTTSPFCHDIASQTAMCPHPL